MSAPAPIVVIGAGHNGLVCAALLARAGRPVLVLESADAVGGCARTREFAPGFRAGGCAHVVDALPASLVRELGLEGHGLRFAASDLPTVALDPAGAHLTIAGDTLSGAGAADARAWADFAPRMRRHAALLAHLFGVEPFGPELRGWPDRLRALALGLHIRLRSRTDLQEILRIAAMNAYDLLTDHFESPLLRGALAVDATLGADFAARSPGTVFTLLHRWAGRGTTGGRGIAIPQGGPGAVAQALASAARAAGVQIRTGTRVRRIQVQGDRACGVVLDSGETIAASAVVSCADPRKTYLELLGAAHLDTDLVRRISHHRSRGRVARLLLALDRRPAIAGLAESAHGARFIACGSPDALELAFDPSKYGQLPDTPAIEFLLPSVADPSLAPQGRHVLSANVMFVPDDLGPDPEASRQRLLESSLRVLERHAPGLRASVLHSELLTPADIEREYGVTGGHWHHGALALDQFFFARPVAGVARYAAPVAGVWLCGAGAHPGGGISGWPGRNAARAILRQGGSHAGA